LQIAGVAVAHDPDLATRKQADFAGLGITIVDPWSFGD
jgi:hypothetical protein